MKGSQLILVVLATTLSFVTASLVGNPRSTSVKDDDVIAAANQAVMLMKDKANGLSMQLISVKSAKTQVIAGIKYIITMEISVDGQVKECTLEVTRRADLGGEWFVDSNDTPCNKYSSKPRSYLIKRPTGHLGGREALSVDDPAVKEAANWAVTRINGRSNSLFRDVLEKIADVTFQVVQGHKYRFLLYLISTTCRNNGQNVQEEDCPPADKPQRRQCDVTVLYFREQYSLLKSECKPMKPILGKGKHDFVPHGKALLGGDKHDFVPHGKALLGGDKHDFVPHGKALLGGDKHDFVPHGKTLLGGDKHDFVPHEKALLGGDKHDFVPHGKAILGGDDHDNQPHKQGLIGRDDHDYNPHGTNQRGLLGRDWHDYIPHTVGLMNNVRKDVKKLLQFGKGILHRSGVSQKLKKLGGDTHDYQRHEADPCHIYHSAFHDFKLKYERLYASAQEEEEKFQIFCGNMERVKEYQTLEQGSAIYGATKFADISEKEFKETYLGFRVNQESLGKWPSAKIPEGQIPDSWDWRDHNVVTPVKNQGNCGSCWAFSTTGNIEGVNAIKNKKLVSLSEQELVDCDKIDEGCNGGLPSQAYEAIMELGGIETEKDYKYDGEDETCKFDKSEVAVKLSGAVNISQDEGDMASWLYKNGPISIGINAFAMQFYMGGIAHPWKMFCNPNNLDHGVLIVGYGVEGSESYWIVKNSWGPSWGRNGYYYVYRGSGVCGLNKMCTSAVVSKDGE